jgi:cystathionine beta-lyase/cystathionine gamma-synthase
MEGGWNATFSILLSEPAMADKLPDLLRYFIPATSLGGVESLISKPHRGDPKADPRLLRLSIGVEELEDLKADIRQGLQQLVQAKARL